MLGDNIKRKRKDKKISINKLSELTGISLGYLSDLENGKATNPSLNKLQLIASALNCPINELLVNLNINLPNKYTGPINIIKYVLSQDIVMEYGQYDINKFSEKDKMNFLNDFLQQLKIISQKYNLADKKYKNLY